MTALEIPQEGLSWDLVVVDNGSTDSTNAVLRSFTRRLPLHAVREPTPGLSNARNKAVAVAAGEYIIWTDDDVLVDREWLVEYARAFESYPSVAFFGGPIRAWFDEPSPDWLAPHIGRLGDAFAIRDFEARDEPIAPGYLPFGANMAFRRDALSAAPFDPTLGRIGTGMLGGEETLLMLNLLDRGYAGRWVPSAGVRHFIERSRQTTRYLRRFYSGGATTQALLNPDDASSRILWGRPRWLWRAALQNELKYRVHRLIAGPEVWIEDLIHASVAQGMLRARRDG